MPREAHRVAFSNNKGGAMKTTWCKEIAATLARRGSDVLVIDMDPQANLTRRMGVADDPEHPRPTVSEAIKANQPGCIADAIVPCGWDDAAAARIDVVPSRIDLEMRVSEAAILGSVLRLRTALGDVTDEYDWVLIDCAPSMGAGQGTGKTGDGVILGGTVRRRGGLPLRGWPCLICRGLSTA